MSDQRLASAPVTLSDVERLHYLKLLGIPTWLPRGSAELSTPPAFTDWRDLTTSLPTCQRCHLHAAHSTFPPLSGSGDHHATWFFVTHAPTLPALKAGEILNAAAADLFSAMLTALGLLREQIYLSAAVKCVIAGRAPPSPCADYYLKEEIALVKPRIIIAFGEAAAMALLPESAPLQRGHPYPLAQSGAQSQLLMTHAPDYLLANPLAKREAWIDLLRAKSLQ
ncbi:MAG: uracil-DNA glycosylase [Gammaproteobacteria bacterium]|nr:uracil-DNA glycosylase [Gammaproteobacteria bacterium]